MTPPLPVVHARRILSAIRRGNTWPVKVETESGAWFTKLRGAAHGTAALIAEIVVAELAEALGLRVPRRALVRLDAGTPTDDRDQELGDLLRASTGLNMGFEWLDGVHELRAEDAATIDSDSASRIVWLDGLVMNVDRTPRNPNILVRGRDHWLVDHGSALTFQHRWSAVTEESPRRTGAPHPHVLTARATRLAALDDSLAARLSRAALEDALARVPDEFLAGSADRPDADPARHRAAYVAFLWKRLKSPRPFVPGPAAD